MAISPNPTSREFRRIFADHSTLADLSLLTQIRFASELPTRADSVKPNRHVPAVKM